MSKPNGNGGGRASMLAITREELEVLRREIDWIVGPLEDRTNCFKGGSFDARLR